MSKHVLVKGRFLIAATVLMLACGRRAPAPAPAPVQTREPVPPAVLGLIIPQTGTATLRQYGDLVLEGVQLALAQHKAAGGNVQLVIVDDSGNASLDGAALRKLEQQRVIGVIGPMLSRGVQNAAQARQDTSLVVMSPTASDEPAARNAYTLNAGNTDGAAALARYARGAGLTHIAALYLRSADGLERMRAFRAAVVQAGGRISLEVPYDSGTTTFARQIRSLINARPQAVFIAASERDVPQIAPQLSYYGLDADKVQILGGREWTEDEFVRTMPAKYINGIVAITPLLKSSPDVGWKDFVTLYEQSQRRTLDNPYPALGFDAANLILSATPPRARAADVSRRLAITHGFRGATGILNIRNGTVVRTPFVVRINDGQLVPAERSRTEGAPR